MSGLSSQRSAQPLPVDDSPTVRKHPSTQSDQQSGTNVESARTVIRRGSTDVPPPPADQATPADVAQVLVGAELGHFRLECLIGGGGMGAVFRAADTRLDRTVAVKVIPRVGEDPDLLRRFKNEAQNAAKLDHPNIARVYDVGQENGWHYIVFEYIDGINLRDLVTREGVLSIDDAIFYIRQVAEALEHAHDRGVVHRDVKPSNVLVTSNGNIKLVDMGLARSQHDFSEDMTASGVTLGTFDYISPEQARDPRIADVRSDLYSLGCTLFFILVGHPPFPNGSIVQKLMSHGNAKPPNPQNFRPEIPSDLTAIIHKLLEKKASRRYPRPIDLIADLHYLAEQHELSRAASIGAGPSPASKGWPIALQQHLPWIVAFGLLMVSTLWVQMASSDYSELEIPPPEPGTTTKVLAPELIPRTKDLGASTSDETQSEPTAGVTNTYQDTVTIDPAYSGETASTVATLADALAYAADHTEITTILLKSDLITSASVTIPRGDLTIQTAEGFDGVIEFQQEQPTTSMEPLVMITLNGNATKFQNVHFVWPTGQAREGGTLFGISGALREKIDLVNCSITIENTQRRDNVYAFHIKRPKDELTDEPHTWFVWTDCVFRGQMTLIGMDVSSKLGVNWTNGLLATSQRFLEAGGAMTEPSAISPVELQIHLERVTAYCGAGFGLVSLLPSAPYPVVIDRVSNNCAYVFDVSARHFEMRGISDLELTGQDCLRLKGKDNVYDPLDENSVIYRISDMSGGIKEYTWLDLEDAESWFSGFDEQEQASSSWLKPVPPEGPPQSHQVSDYLPFGPSAGFDHKSPPKLPKRLQSP